MNAQQAAELGKQIQKLQEPIVAYVTDGRMPDQPAKYRELYADNQISLELAKYQHPNPHNSSEAFWAFCKSQEMKSYAIRRAYVEDIYVDIRLDLKRVQAHKPGSRNWTRANEAAAGAAPLQPAIPLVRGLEPRRSDLASDHIHQKP